MRSCVVCKTKMVDEKLNGFQECEKASCSGTFMNNLRKGDKPMFPAEKKKPHGYRTYTKIKKATKLDDKPPTQEEEQSLADKA